jgi:hypothetical protein
MILYCRESKLEEKKLKTLLSVPDTYLCTGWSRLWLRSETAPTKKAPPVGDILGLSRQHTTRDITGLLEFPTKTAWMTTVYINSLVDNSLHK